MSKLRSVLILMLFSVAAKAQLPLLGWQQGCIYDKAGNGTTGLVSWEPPSMGMTLFGDENIIRYRKDSKDKKIKISLFELKGFIMAADSFVISNDTAINEIVLRVEVNRPVKLYRSFQRSANRYNRSIVSTYYYGKDPDHVKELNRNNFAQIMPLILTDQPDLIAQINDKKIRYGDMETIIAPYRKNK